MGSYSAWSSAVTTFLFPEATLSPLAWTSPSTHFNDLVSAVQNGGVLDPDVLNPDPQDSALPHRRLPEGDKPYAAGRADVQLRTVQ